MLWESKAEMSIWDSMIGQPDAVRVLKAAALDGRRIAGSESTTEPGMTGGQHGALSHAWLITGPPGSGRSLAAKCLAAALQCTGTEIGCGQCPGCHTTMAGTNPDVDDISTDLVQFTIDDVKTWVERAYTAPSQGRWRVMLVEDADRMVERTSNVLLKSIEEPAERSIWILCAPTTEEVIPTIRSRSRSLVLRTPSAEDVAAYLAKEQGVPEQKALEAAKLAQSHVGVARALLRHPELRENRRRLMETCLTPTSVGEAVLAAGRLIDAAGDQAKERTDARNEAEREALFRSLGIDNPKRIPPAHRAQVRQMEDDQKRRAKRGLTDTLDLTLVDLLGFYRDVLTVQLGAKSDLVHIDMTQRVGEMAESSTAESTLRKTAAIDEGRRRLKTNAAPLLVLEAMNVKLLEG